MTLRRFAAYRVLRIARLRRPASPAAWERVHDRTACRAGAPPFDPPRVLRLEYLDAACRETLRLTPIVPLVGRRLAFR